MHLLQGKDRVKAALVAGNAAADGAFPAAGGFKRQIGIGNEGAPHADHVGAAVGQDLLRYIRIVDPVGGDYRDANVFFHSAGQVGESAAGQMAGNLGNTRFMPAPGNVEAVGAGGFQRRGKADGFAVGIAAGDKVVPRKPDQDREIVSDPLSHPLDHLHAEAAAVGKGTAVGVVPAIGYGGKKLADQVPGAGDDLDRVKTGFLCAQRRRREALDGIFDILCRHLAGSLPGQA